MLLIRAATKGSYWQHERMFLMIEPVHLECLREIGVETVLMIFSQVEDSEYWLDRGRLGSMKEFFCLTVIVQL